MQSWGLKNFLFFLCCWSAIEIVESWSESKEKEQSGGLLMKTHFCSWISISCLAIISLFIHFFYMCVCMSEFKSPSQYSKNWKKRVKMIKKDRGNSLKLEIRNSNCIGCRLKISKKNPFRKHHDDHKEK